MSALKTRVLLVEDGIADREILAFYLNTIFDEIVEAEDGEMGLEKYQEYFDAQKTFNLVLTDIKMPKRDGLSMIEAIAKINSKQEFIIVSSYKSEDYLLKSINMNVISYFVKPLEIKNVMAMLKKVKERILQEYISKEIIHINKTYQYHTGREILYENNQIVSLSNKELLLLKAMLNNIDAIKTKEELKLAIWNDSNALDITLRTVMKRLKDKIALDDFIISKKGRGYYIAND